MDATKRGRGHSGEDEETVTTALPREDESPRNTDDKATSSKNGVFTTYHQLMAMKKTLCSQPLGLVASTIW